LRAVLADPAPACGADVTAPFADQLAAVASAGINLTAVTDQLLEAGVGAFSDAMDRLLATLDPHVSRV
jgi:hypothetical protein